ncbi:MAG: adenosylcobinamide-phosphate synthase CbiB [Pseudomonadota bacterium]
MTPAAILALALILDAIFGEPEALWSRAPHPAVLLGRVVSTLDRSLNTGGARRLKGALAVLGLVCASGIIGWIIHALPDAGVLECLAVAVLVAQKSLIDHVRGVAQGLRKSLADGRQQVAMIVGRDTAHMDQTAVARAAIESAAENFSDGVVAPIFWYALLGLPGILIYKAVNTADSMIGYRTPQHAAFGWAAARLDDVLNWVPARLTAGLIAALSGTLAWWPAIAADARLHRSPNAGWPEAAMARALGAALSGPRSYHGEMRDFPFVYSEGRRDAGPDDIDATVRKLWQAWAIFPLTAALLAVIF